MDITATAYARSENRWIQEQSTARRLERSLPNSIGVRQTLPAGDPLDPHFKRLKYCRYADDFVIGVIGSRAEAEAIREKVTTFLTVHTELDALRKSNPSGSREQREPSFWDTRLATHSARKTIRIKRGRRHTQMKSVANRCSFISQKGRFEQVCTEKRYGNYHTFTVLHRLVF